MRGKAVRGALSSRAKLPGVGVVDALGFAREVSHFLGLNSSGETASLRG
jgi:hypothetical protein